MSVNGDGVEKKVIEDNAEYLNTFADALDKAKRMSTQSRYDVLYAVEIVTEGTKVIQISDEIAKELAERLREIAKEL